MAGSGMGLAGGLLSTAVLYAASLACTEAFELTIVHWNDVHARNTPASEGGQQLCLEAPYTDPACYGGHARIATMCKQAKASSPSTLCIDAGDEFAGTSWDVLFKGAQNGPVLEAVGVDVMAVGNHEFDYGVGALAAFIDNVTFPLIGACNMDTSLEPSLAIKKWHVVTVEGRKVALLGYIAEDTGSISSAGAVTFSNPMTAVPACIEEFTASPDSEGVNIIGLVSHAGVAVDRGIADIAMGVDFIVSAHSHTAMFPGMVGQCLNWTAGVCEAQDDSSVEYPLTVNGIPILQQFYASKYIGVATLTFDETGALTASAAESVPLGTYYSSVEEDAAVVALLEGGFRDVVALSADIVGSLPEALTAARPDIRVQEMPLGNVICDAMLQALAQSGFKKSEGTPVVCFMNGGGIRAGLPAGEVSFGDVATVLPFGNNVEVLEITGAQLKGALEWGYDSVEMVSDPPGKYPHLGGGLTAIIDSSQPAGQRILVLQYNCGNISATDTLHLATNNFVAGGGDGYTMLESLPRVLGFGPSLDQALADYLSSNTRSGSVLLTDGRFADVSSDTEAKCPLDGSGVLAPGAAPDPFDDVVSVPGSASNPTAAEPFGGAAAPTPADDTVEQGDVDVDQADRSGGQREADTAGAAGVESGVPVNSRRPHPQLVVHVVMSWLAMLVLLSASDSLCQVDMLHTAP